MEIEALQRMLLDKHGLRVTDAMGAYVLKALQSSETEPIAIIGGDSRTGIPVRMMIPPESLRPETGTGAVA